MALGTLVLELRTRFSPDQQVQTEVSSALSHFTPALAAATCEGVELKMKMLGNSLL